MIKKYLLITLLLPVFQGLNAGFISDGFKGLMSRVSSKTKSLASDRRTQVTSGVLAFSLLSNREAFRETSPSLPKAINRRILFTRANLVFELGLIGVLSYCMYQLPKKEQKDTKNSTNKINDDPSNAGL